MRKLVEYRTQHPVSFERLPAAFGRKVPRVGIQRNSVSLAYSSCVGAESSLHIFSGADQETCLLGREVEQGKVKHASETARIVPLGFTISIMIGMPSPTPPPLRIQASLFFCVFHAWWVLRFMHGRCFVAKSYYRSTTLMMCVQHVIREGARHRLRPDPTANAHL